MPRPFCGACKGFCHVKECVERGKDNKLWLVERCIRCGNRLTAKKWTKDGVREDD